MHSAKTKHCPPPPAMHLCQWEEKAQEEEGEEDKDNCEEEGQDEEAEDTNDFIPRQTWARRQRNSTLHKWHRNGCMK